jgi:hypothetical protein
MRPGGAPARWRRKSRNHRDLCSSVRSPRATTGAPVLEPPRLLPSSSALTPRPEPPNRPPERRASASFDGATSPLNPVLRSRRIGLVRSGRGRSGTNCPTSKSGQSARRADRRSVPSGREGLAEVGSADVGAHSGAGAGGAGAIPPFATVAFLAARWGVSVKTVKREVKKRGRLRGFLAGGRLRIPRSEVERYEAGPAGPTAADRPCPGPRADEARGPAAPAGTVEGRPPWEVPAHYNGR